MADKFISFATAGGFSAAPFAIPLHFCSFHFHNVSSPAMHIKMFKKRKHTGKLGGWETGKLGNWETTSRWPFTVAYSLLKSFSASAAYNS